MNKISKKLFILLISFVLVTSLMACGGEGPTQPPNQDQPGQPDEPISPNEPTDPNNSHLTELCEYNTELCNLFKEGGLIAWSLEGLGVSVTPNGVETNSNDDDKLKVLQFVHSVFSDKDNAGFKPYLSIDDSIIELCIYPTVCWYSQPNFDYDLFVDQSHKMDDFLKKGKQTFSEEVTFGILAEDLVEFMEGRFNIQTMSLRVTVNLHGLYREGYANPELERITRLWSGLAQQAYEEEKFYSIHFNLDMSSLRDDWFEFVTADGTEL